MPRKESEGCLLDTINFIVGASEVAQNLNVIFGFDKEIREELERRKKLKKENQDSKDQNTDDH